MSDSELISAILRGQTTLFEKLVDRYLPLVRGVCASRFRDPATVDDLTQDTFITGFRNLNKLRNPARFGPWLATIARNTCTSHLRSVTRRSAMVERAAKEPNGRAESPEAIAQRRELYAWVHRAIDKLPDKTREAMVLHYVEGLSTTDVAAQTGIRESAVRKRLQYGRQLVGETLWKEVEAQRAAAKPDTETAKRRVLKALPLAAAPWLMDGGKAAAATGLVGSLGLGGLAKIGLGAAIVVAGALAWNASRDRSETTSAGVSLDTEAAARDVSSVPPPAQENQTGSAEADAGSSTATGALTVQVNLKRKDPHPAERTDSGAVVKQLVYQPPIDSGQAVPRANVRVIAMRFDATRIESLFARTEVDPELAKRVVNAISAIYESRLGMIHGAASESERTNAALIMAESGVSEADMQDAMNQLEQALSESGNPNESIMGLLFAPDPQSEWVEEATDDNGSLTISGLAPGRYFVAARDPRVAHEWPAPKPDDVSVLQSMDTTGTGMMETAIGDIEPQQVTVLIDDERSRFTGTVVDKATGDPIEKARVEVVSLDVPGEEDYTHTNADGQYWITPNRVGYGTLHVRVTADNYQPVEFSQ
ncbi:MAG: sigma-70 family RNA polymerase sigma factor, partial [Candidatus Hydrogenedentes bacterium]|nr:sigma-70 family RNA polymerase sigma factor [Candidatus Hydrogenedentota bacterium]